MDELAVLALAHDSELDGDKDAEKSAGTDWMCELNWILLSLDRAQTGGKTGAKESGSGLKYMYRGLSGSYCSGSLPRQESSKCNSCWVVACVAARRFPSRRATNLDRALVDGILSAAFGDNGKRSCVRDQSFAHPEAYRAP